jgi:hypothetical protein
MPIPWAQVMLHGPKVLDAATAMFDKWQSRPRPEAVDPNAEVRTQISSIVKRLQVLEEAEAAQAEVTKNMAEQVQGLSAGLTELSRKAALAAWLAGGALAVSVVALVVAIVR